MACAGSFRFNAISLSSRFLVFVKRAPRAGGTAEIAFGAGHGENAYEIVTIAASSRRSHRSRRLPRWFFSEPKSPSAKQIAQKDLAFLPSLLAGAGRTRVEFPNLDDTLPNNFFYSPAKRFDLGRYRPEERPIPSEAFDAPGLVVLRCDIHEHMRGLILVLSTPFFAVTDADGRFRLRGLPEGALHA